MNDQIGRLTASSDLAAGIAHLVTVGAPAGTYNLTSAGTSRSWFEIAQRVFVLCGRDAADVTPQSSAEFAAGRVAAARPHHSTLALDKITATGFQPRDGDDVLEEFVRALSPTLDA